MKRELTLSLGVILAREAVDDTWIDHVWRARAVFAGAGPIEMSKELRRGKTADGREWIEYHAATLPLELHARETEAYRVNLADSQPSIYVVLRDTDEDENENEAGSQNQENGTWPMTVHLVTASAFEAQDYLDTGEDEVEAVPMPDDILTLVEGFIEAHHVEQKFIKRKQRKVDPDEHKFGKVPIFLDRRQGSGRGPRE